MLDWQLDRLHKLMTKDEAGTLTPTEKVEMLLLMDAWEEEQKRHPQNLSCFMGEEQITVGIQTDVQGGL